MAVKLRLRRLGRSHAPYYHIVAADARSPRDGRFIEKIGTYNPIVSPAQIEIDHELALKWLKNGAIPTDTVRSILSDHGIMLKLHLTRKGKSADEIEQKYNDWKLQKDRKLTSAQSVKETKQREQKNKLMELESKKRQERLERIAKRDTPAAEESAEAPAAEE